MRYHFHQIHSDRTVYDIEGGEYDSLAAARCDAIVSARELMASAILEGRDIRDWAFDITNALGGIDEHFCFSSAIDASR